MPSHSPATLPRFGMAIKPEERETIAILARVLDRPASAVVRDLLAEAAKRHAGEIAAYRALRASANRPPEAI